MTDETRVVHTVVKVGGGLLSRAGALDLVVEALTAFSPRRRIVIIPGGGPFAEAVRTMFRRVKIGEDAAHWMAVLGMDQYAHALASRLPSAVLRGRASSARPARGRPRLPERRRGRLRARAPRQSPVRRGCPRGTRTGRRRALPRSTHRPSGCRAGRTGRPA